MAHKLQTEKGATVFIFSQEVDANFKTKFDWQLNVLFFYLENIWLNIHNPDLRSEIEFSLTGKAVDIFFYYCQPFFNKC